jgi:hypothetical protein
MMRPSLNPTANLTVKLCLAALTALVLNGCGGGGGSSSSLAPQPSGIVTPPAPTIALAVSSVEYAQTHILPEGGLSWTLPSDTGTLTLVGGRETLALVTLGVSDAVNPAVTAKSADGAVLGKIPLNAPTALPPTEAAGAPYKSGLYSASLPAAWLVPGLSLSVSADNYLSSAASTPKIGAPSKIELNIIPFYLFGATDTNTLPLTSVQAPSATASSDIFDKWPIAQLAVKPFSGARVTLPTLVVSPRTDRNGVKQAAYSLANMDQQQDGYAAMSATLGLMSKMRQANGESATNNLYYGPMLTLNAAGRAANLGGGLGGGGGGVGDTAYTGIFIHEMGHAFGLPHAIDGFNGGKYPYAGGSTKGSAWGFNQNAKIFLNLLIDKSASSFANCAASKQIAADGRCYKQDPMQGGHEDRTPGFTFGTFSDYNIGKIQQFFEGRTTLNTAGARVYSGGVITPDANVPSGYVRWDALDRKYVEYVPTTSENGLYGINNNLPIAKNIAVNTIMVAFSRAGSPGASMIYPPVRHTGNLITTFDPTKAQDLADFTINTGKHAWYCAGYGCDYTLRVTYSDGSVIHRVLKDGFRSWFKPTDPLSAGATDPKSSDSFRTWAINVPGDKAISKIEMLDTPKAWLGLPANPTVLLSVTG